MTFKKLSIIIPAYNEGPTIHFILEKIDSVILLGNLEKEIIVVDDCSSDQTVDRLNDYMKKHPDQTIQLIQHPKNQGKGAALHTGIKQATEIGRAHV